MPLRSFAPFLTFLTLTTIILLCSGPNDGGHYAEEDHGDTSQSPFKSFFSFQGPSTLFAPSAIISLTDDNSTFFNARPAAFGPELPLKGFSGPVWAGHSFSDDDYSEGGLISADSGELGCSDMPGWGHSRWPSQQGNEGRGGYEQEHTDPSDDPLEQRDATERQPNSVGESRNIGIPWRHNATTEITGKIALLSRGGCGFHEKIMWAQRRGATAVIVGDNNNGGPLVTMYAKGDTSNVDIPSLFTSHMTAHLLASLVPQSPELATARPQEQEQSARHGVDSHPELHDGLWVTLSLISGGAGPFFNTLFVLVVSPLVTLAIVYIMLMVRARIRRRRWRAPKSIVDRLPVRVYHAMSSRASPEASATPTAPSSPSATTPLLIANRGGHDRSVPDEEQGIPSSSYGSFTADSSLREKPAQDIPGSKPKYNQKQVECAVCLEEYEDGISRVMSLPCGHDFHAECVTPWLTTKRRTCPICKGDVVRSLGGAELSPSSSRSSRASSEVDVQVQAAESVNRSPSAAMPLILRREEIDELDLERDTVDRRHDR